MKIVYLVYIATLSTSGGVSEKYFPMSSMEICIHSVEKAQVHVPNGGDAESTVSVFCTEGKKE